MKIVLFLLLISLAFVTNSCTFIEAIRSQESTLLDSTDKVDTNTVALDTTSEFNAYYIVNIACGYDYDSLDKIGKNIAATNSLVYTTYDRIYTTQKGIILPDDAEDEIYRGGYYPRRYADRAISIEMYYDFLPESATNTNVDSAFNNSPAAKKMILVGGVFDKFHKKSADSLTQLLLPLYPFTKIINAMLYDGCMH